MKIPKMLPVSFLGGIALFAALCATAFAQGPDDATVNDQIVVTSDLNPHPGCLILDKTVEATVANGAAGTTKVTFQIPSRTVIRLDASGDPVSVTTNTQTAPCESDEFLVVDAEGNWSTASRELREQVLSNSGTAPQENYL